MTTTAGLTEKSQATGHAAALASRPSTKSLREQICQYLICKVEEGATDGEIRTALAINPSAQHPRGGDRFTKDKVAESGRRVLVWGVL